MQGSQSGGIEYRVGLGPGGYTLGQDRAFGGQDLSPYGSVTPHSGDFDPYYDNPEMRLGISDGIQIPFLRPVRPYRELLEIKKAQALNLVIVIPTLNEGTKLEKGMSNIGRTLDNLQPLIQHGLVDRIVVVDSGSTDDTRERVLEREVEFVKAPEILSQWGHEGVRGKGANLRVAVDKFHQPTDLLVFCDADWSAGTAPIQAIVSPLIEDSNVHLSLAVLERITHQGGGPAVPGGRVTKLTFKPLARIFFPEIEGLVQPIAGLYAGRGSALADHDFPTDYRVETSVLIDTLMKYGPEAIAQVYAGVKDQIGQSTEKLERMATQIAYEIITKALQYGRVPDLKTLMARRELNFPQFPIYRDEKGAIIGRRDIEHRLVTLPSKARMEEAQV